MSQIELMGEKLQGFLCFFCFFFNISMIWPWPRNFVQESMQTLYAKALCEWSEGQIDTRLDKIWAGHVFYSYFIQMSAMTLTFELEILARSLQTPFIQRYSDSDVWTRIDMGRKYSQDNLYWTEWDRWMDEWMISIVCQQSGNIIINTCICFLQLVNVLCVVKP